MGGLRVDPEVAEVAARAARAFEEMGAVVEEVKPGFADTHEMIRVLWAAHEAGNYAQLPPGVARPHGSGPRGLHRGRDARTAWWTTSR